MFHLVRLDGAFNVNFEPFYPIFPLTKPREKSQFEVIFMEYVLGTDYMLPCSSVWLQRFNLNILTLSVQMFVKIITLALLIT